MDRPPAYICGDDSPMSFLRKKGGAIFLWAVGPAARAVPSRASSQPCFAWAAWHDVRRLEIFVVCNAWQLSLLDATISWLARQGWRQGEWSRGPGKGGGIWAAEQAASGPAALDGWCVPPGGQPGADNARLFSVEKTP